MQHSPYVLTVCKSVIPAGYFVGYFFVIAIGAVKKTKTPPRKLMELVLANNRRSDCKCEFKIDPPSSAFYF